MDIATLKLLLPILSAFRVTKYRDSDVTLEFEPSYSNNLLNEIPKDPIKEEQVVELKDPPEMPVDLKSDDLMNYDKVLNWSASPDSSDEPPLPLTGDEKL